jgi:hypothetical protein
MKNFKFYTILILFFFILVELLSFFIVEIKINNLKNSLVLKMEYNPEIIRKYSKYIPYTRGKTSFNKTIGHTAFNKSHVDLNKNIYFYTEVNDFDQKNSENILLQGDSWAERLNKKKDFFQIKKYSKINNVGFINAGTSSFSPSAMTSQLFILEKEFKIRPSIIIAIIDQTDIGDELLRYKSINQSLLSSTLFNTNKDFKINAIKNLSEFNFSSFKLIEYLFNYYLLHKRIYEFNNTEIINIIYKKIKAKFLKIPQVLYPLQLGLSSNEKKIVKKRFENYINFAFKNKKLKKLYFVSHPHLKHVNSDDYIINVSSIIDEVINESSFKINIAHINFGKTNWSKNDIIYLQTDPYSHLTPDGYSNYYLPAILKKIKF